jgi:crotonobetainyl-CoA:carnitine CoA-transferase CaiB-like acyl-CoA transferase
LIDFQFEVITTYLNDGGKLPDRAGKGNAHAYLSAPYGIYKTLDGYMVIAMGDLGYLGKSLGVPDLATYQNKKEWFTKRDEITEILSDFLKHRATHLWLSLLEPAGIWCADVYDYNTFLNHEGYKTLQMDQQIKMAFDDTITTIRCPIRIDGEKMFSSKGGPSLGENTIAIDLEFKL